MELEAEEGVRCSPLCQHPGCWHSGEGVSKWPSRYAHRLSELATVRTCKSTDSHIHSYTVDGLPTLKVQTLTQEGISERARPRSNTSPAPLQCSKLASKPLTLPKVTYAQIMLEEGDEGYSEDEIVLKRVLIWRPGLRKRSHDCSAGAAVHEAGWSSPETFEGQEDKLRASKEEPMGATGSLKSCSVATTKVKRSPAESSETTAVTDKPKSETGIGYQSTDKRRWSPNKTSKSALKLYKTNLTGSLPCYTDQRHTPKASASLQQWNLKRFSAPDAMSLSYLGDIDLPPQVVEEILQQLRSESTNNTDNIDLGAPSLTQTPALDRLSSKLSRKSKTSSLHTVLEREQCDLSHKRVLNVSGSGLSIAAQRRLSHMTSFSRGLSNHPLDALKVHASKQKTKLSEQIYNVAEHKSSGWKEVGDIFSERVGTVTSTHISHPAQQNRQLAPLNLRASGHTSCLHARDSGRAAKSLGQSAPHSDRHPSHRRTEAASDRWIVRGANDIIIPVETLRMPHTINLNLNSISKQRIQSHSFKDSKVASRFISVPKSRYSPRWSQSYSANTEEQAASGSYTTLFARGQTSRLGNTHLAHPGLQRLMCPSPDYMVVAAKFAEGQLILTDNEGLVTQHLTTDAESPEPSVSPTGDNEATGPPPTMEPIQENGCEPTEQDLAKHKEETEKREHYGVPVGSRAPPVSAVEEVRRNC